MRQASTALKRTATAAESRLSAATVWGIVLALSVAGWMLTARLVRGHVLALKTRDYVTGRYG